MDRLVDEGCGVVDDRVVHVLGELGPQLGHLGADPLGRFQSIRAGQLVDAQGDRRLAVEGTRLVVANRAEFDPRADVLQLHRPAVHVGLEDDVAELLGVLQPAERVDRVLEHLARRGRRLADLPGGDLGVLLLDGPDRITRRQVPRGQLVRVEPDAHRVVALAEEGDVPHPFEPGEFVTQLDRGVVAEVHVAAAPLGRPQVDDHQLPGGLLLHRDPTAADDVRQHPLGQVDAVLHQYLGDVQVGPGLERYGQRVGAVVAADRRKVQHPLDAVDLLLDGRRDRVLDDAGVGPGVDRRDLDGRRGDLGVERDRQPREAHRPAERDEDRQDGGGDRAIDEEAGEHGAKPSWGRRGSSGGRQEPAGRLNRTLTRRKTGRRNSNLATYRTGRHACRSHGTSAATRFTSRSTRT